MILPDAITRKDVEIGDIVMHGIFHSSYLMASRPATVTGVSNNGRDENEFQIYIDGGSVNSVDIVLIKKRWESYLRQTFL
jgi:hypothetical protein